MLSSSQISFSVRVRHKGLWPFLSDICFFSGRRRTDQPYQRVKNSSQKRRGAGSPGMGGRRGGLAEGRGLPGRARPSAAGYTPSPAVARRCLHTFGWRRSAVKSKSALHRALLEFLVCLPSEKRLRYETSTNELMNEESRRAHPIIEGIPHMVPQAARRTRQIRSKKKWSSSRASWKTTHTTEFSFFFF